MNWKKAAFSTQLHTLAATVEAAESNAPQAAFDATLQALCSICNCSGGPAGRYANEHLYTSRTECDATGAAFLQNNQSIRVGATLRGRPATDPSAIHAGAISGSPHRATPTRQTGVDETSVDDVFKLFPMFLSEYFF